MVRVQEHATMGSASRPGSVWIQIITLAPLKTAGTGFQLLQHIVKLNLVTVSPYFIVFSKYLLKDFKFKLRLDNLVKLDSMH